MNKIKYLETLKRKALKYSGDMKLPKKYYQYTSGNYPGGRSWVMWFLDQEIKELKDDHHT